MINKKSVSDIVAMKGREKIAMLTCYDSTSAELMDGLVDMILVGDSYGMVMLGYDDTTKVTTHDMLQIQKAVERGAKNTFLVFDMPAHSYDDELSALQNAKEAIKAGAHAVKIEGNSAIAAYLVRHQIEVIGHIGLTPQTITDFKVQGKTQEQAQKILADAKELAEAGCFALVIECVPSELGKKITQSLKIPTIGIGAGSSCDGQVLVMQDMLGMFEKFQPRFVKRYAEIGEEMRKAFRAYSQEVKNGEFPEQKHSFN